MSTTLLYQEGISQVRTQNDLHMTATLHEQAINIKLATDVKGIAKACRDYPLLPINTNIDPPS